MRTVSATTASRGFSELLDAVADGDTVTITRGGRPVAEIRPVRRRTVGGLRARLEGLPALDLGFEADVVASLDLLRADEVSDPWADA